MLLLDTRLCGLGSKTKRVLSWVPRGPGLVLSFLEKSTQQEAEWASLSPDSILREEDHRALPDARGCSTPPAL